MLEYIFCFFIGMFFMYCLSALMALGHSVNILRRAQISVAAMFLVSEQGINEVLQLKYLIMKEAKRSEQNITAQIHIDQVSLQSVRKSIMRNYLTTFPESYSNIMEYRTWEEMEKFANRIASQGDKIT